MSFGHLCRGSAEKIRCALHIGQGKDTTKGAAQNLAGQSISKIPNMHETKIHALQKNSRLTALAAVAIPADDLPNGKAVDIVMGLLLSEGAGR